MSNHTTWLVATVLAGCSIDVAMAPPPDPAQAWVVYGTDDRREPYEFTQPVVRRISSAVAAVVPDTALTLLPGGIFEIAPDLTLGETHDLCPGTAFEDQPTPASCTAFFVGSDLVVTAGHCVSDATCPSTSFVFGYRMQPSGDVRDEVPFRDVYQCESIVDSVINYPLDYAVVRVDRTITSRNPLALRQQGAVSEGARVAMFGHPNGLPQKIDIARVQASPDPAIIEVNLDAFSGNSGSPVFNPVTRKVEGVLSGGSADFVWNGTCNEVNVCPETGCPGFEFAVRSTEFADVVATSMGPEDCGNGVCDVGESCDGRLGTFACSQDCEGQTSGPAFVQFCIVNGFCIGNGC